MKNLKASHILFLLLVSLLLTACALPGRTPVSIAPETIFKETDSPAQALLVTNERFLFWTSRHLQAFEKREGTWRQAFDPMKAVVGRSGIARQGEKREGDGRTPSGLFRLGPAFGYAPQIRTKMPYRQAKPDDLWVDDPQAPDYNRWVKQSETQAASYEKMKRDDDQYKYGIVIDYNTEPVIPGNGSAIFLHVWKNPESPTAGCVAVSEENIVRLLDWLDPAAHPVIVIHPD